MTKEPLSLKTSIQAGLSSGKENALPGFILWLVALFLVIAYYLIPQFSHAFEIIGALKTRGGFAYSVIATSIFGGFIPFLFRFIKNPKSFTAPIWASGLFLVLFWGWKGFEVDVLYRVQDTIFGSGPEFSKVAPKVIIDQFVYGPLWAGWTQAIAYAWMETSFSFKNLKESLTFKSFLWKSITVLISSIVIWLPMVSVIYAMPANLQIPLFNIVLCFWGIMLGSLTKK